MQNELDLKNLLLKRKKVTKHLIQKQISYLRKKSKDLNYHS